MKKTLRTTLSPFKVSTLLVLCGIHTSNIHVDSASHGPLILVWFKVRKYLNWPMEEDVMIPSPRATSESPLAYPTMDSTLKRYQKEGPNSRRSNLKESSSTILVGSSLLFLVGLGSHTTNELQSFISKEDYTYFSSKVEVFCQDEMVQISY